MTRPSPARAPRRRAVDALRVAVLALGLSLGVLAVLPTQGALADDQPAATVTADPTSDPSAPSPTDGASPSSTADPSPTATADPTPSDPPSTTAPEPTSTDAPSDPPTDTPPTSGADDPASPSPSPGPTPVPSDAPTGAATAVPLSVDHVVLARVGTGPTVADYLPADSPLTDAAAFEQVRVRFELADRGGTDEALTPLLEYRVAGSGTAYRAVPAQPTPGEPLHLSREWVTGAHGGTSEAAGSSPIDPADLRLCADPTLAGVTGRHEQMANPSAVLSVPAGACTDYEVTVGLSVDAAYDTTYELRLTDGGSGLDGTASAVVALGHAPGVQLSPGQRSGTAVPDAPTPLTAAAYPLTAGTTLGDTVPVSRPLLAAAADTTEATGTDGIHGPYAAGSGQCAVCHSAHTAQGANLLVTSGPSSSLCLMCHDGLGAASDVKTEYALTRPADSPSTGEYYSHDALAPSSHTLASEEEFAGVLNRHSDCSDCHNAHQARSGVDSVELSDPQNPGVPTGWSASGALAGVTGVAVTNGSAGSEPGYTFLDGVLQPVTHEYQLCFKCHSGYTRLPDGVAGKPSTDITDTAAEFNPANASFHPVEGPGTNRTPAMQASLDGTSPYKLWNFSAGGTVRCLSCHASSQTPDTATPGGSLAPHTSANSGILIRSYQDRVLASTTALYNSGDFALCYVCHAEAPFANASGPGASTATNFDLHGLHLTKLMGYGSGGTDIDTPGDGQGNALCAECHFRTHSTTDGPAGQQVDGSRLVSFAPDVQPDTPGGTIAWTPTGTGSGSCTLTCHGYTHSALAYGG